MKLRVVDPGVLEEFELPGNIPAQADEVQSSIVVGGRAGARWIAVFSAASEYPVSLVDGDGAIACRWGIERIAVIRAANMRADGTLAAVCIRLEVRKVVLISEFRIVCLGREDQRGTTLPAPHHLRREAGLFGRIAAAVIVPGRVVQKPLEPGHILTQLAKDEVGAVAAQVPIARSSSVERQP